MNLISKVFNYFIIIPFKKIFFLNAVKSGNIKFKFYFNFISLLNKSKDRIFYKEKFYFFKDRNWRLFQKEQGLGVYKKGFEKRKERLKSGYLLTELDFQDNDIIIDVDANNGDFYLCFDKKIKYYGIEPSPKVFSNLEYNVKNQILINKGVWKTSEKQIEFFLNDESGDSSIISIKNFTKKIIIETITLDEIIDSINKPIKLIKIEAEGAEPEVLEGLKKNLSKVNYITVDCGFERGVAQTSTIANCLNYLLNNNFEIIKVGHLRLAILLKNNNYNEVRKLVRAVHS